MKKYFIAAVILIVIHDLPVFAQNEFSLRLMPQFTGPVVVENFEPGFGASAFLDWGFLQLPRGTGLGLSLGGGFSQLGTADGSKFSLYEAALGPFFRWRVMDRLTLRGDISAGVYSYRWNDDSNTRARFGGGLSAYFHLLPSVSLFASGGYIHYAFSENRPLNTISAGLGLSLNLGELLRPRARVRGEKTEQQRVFPVSYAWYEKNSIAMVKITNNEPNAITDISLTFFLERYMKEGTVFAMLPRLLPGESAEVPVTALFNESMLDLTENTNGNANVLIDYRSLGAKKQASFPVQMPIYHRNAFAWDDDRRAASFVSARDPAASLFAKYTASAVKRYMAANPGKFGKLPGNVLLAAALFEALNLYGINYVIDPASSYVEMAENASALDSLNYPYQTLMYRGGDCDDLSILFCSLLEVLDIDTAFITIPGHIYCAFDTGILERDGEKDGEGWRAEGLIEHEGRYWMPVELTVPGEGFAEAWRIGLREWRRFDPKTASEFLRNENSADTLYPARAIYPMRESWGLYQPVSVPGAGDRLPAMPDESEILRRFVESVGKL
jgi:hypothetical protein